jgi:hypothetical protein
MWFTIKIQKNIEKSANKVLHLTSGTARLLFLPYLLFTDISPHLPRSSVLVSGELNVNCLKNIIRRILKTEEKKCHPTTNLEYQRY